jgi:hypothetical protein
MLEPDSDTAGFDSETEVVGVRVERSSIPRVYELDVMKLILGQGDLAENALYVAIHEVPKRTGLDLHQCDGGDVARKSNARVGAKPARIVHVR